MINVGVDLHKTQFTICVRGRKGNGFAKYTTDPEGYKAFLSEAAKWQAKGEQVQAAVESTGNARYFRNRLEEAGIGVKVINTLKMKVVNQSVKKTDKHDAATIAEFLEKDMLPESQLCSQESEQLRYCLRVRTSLVRTQVKAKNQIHALLTSEGMEDKKKSLQSKIGRKRVLEALKANRNGVVAEMLVGIIDRQDNDINVVEKQLRTMTKEDRMVELLQTIPGCGDINAWTIRAFTDDIKRFSSPKKYAAFCGLAPWVQNSNEKVHHGSITKRGPKELRTAMVQIVMGLRRLKKKTHFWRLMQRYEAIKKSKGTGKAIIATARKIATIIWHMLTNDVEFDAALMIDPKLARKSEKMSGPQRLASEALAEAQPVKTKVEKKDEGVKKIVRRTGVARKKRKTSG